MKLDIAALSVAILFLVFIAYEIAGGSDNFPDLHTLSFYGHRILWVKILLIVVPPAVYTAWIIWHLDHFVPK